MTQSFMSGSILIEPAVQRVFEPEGKRILAAVGRSSDGGCCLVPMSSVRLTVLATDVVGSSVLWEAMPGVMHGAMLRHLRLWQDAVSNHGGTVFKSVGDGIYATFACAESAVRCAVETRELLEGDRWPDGSPVLVRIALSTGELVQEGDDYFGVAINRLSRLVATAAHTEVLLDSVTRLAAPNGARGATSLGLRMLRGIPEPIEVHSIGGPSAPPPAPALDATSFLGRDELLSTTMEAFAQGQRLVTLTGPGGIGKTRLARELMSLIGPGMRHGAVFVDCGSFVSESEIAAALLSNFGARPTGDPKADLAQLLAGMEAFLVLDCFEGIVGAARWVGGLVASCSDIRILVTSRSVLRLVGEMEVRLKPIPGGQGQWGDRERLFWSFARMATSDLPNETDAADYVTEIAALLEGIPLMLQLGAARLRQLSLKELLEQLRKTRLDLRSGFIDTDRRHEAIESVVSGSMGLIDEADRRLLSELTVFVGPFERPDVFAVCPSATEETLGELRDNSLIDVHATRDAIEFRVFDTVREFLLRESPPSHEIRARHARHYRDKASAWAARRSRGAAKDANEMILKDSGNYRSALATSLELTDTETSSSLCRSLGRPYVELGLWDEFNRLNAVAMTVGDADLQLAILGLQGAACALRGQRETGRRHWLRRLELSRQNSVPEVEIDTLLDLADLATNDGDWKAAQELAGQALRMSETVGEPSILAVALATHAQIDASQGDHASALDKAVRARSLLSSEIPNHVAYSVSRRCAQVCGKCGDVQTAWSDHIACLRAAHEGSILYGVVTGLREVATSPSSHLGAQHRIMALTASLALAKETGAYDLEATRVALVEARSAIGGGIDAWEANAIALGWRAVAEEVLAAVELTTS
ncbi:MAG: adenylate/guanylate cyclase domain-containing protein [Fimbriimonadaceae bacterium]|nr:adenylate/guanylate cyclase domain-containing protein [Fimbriimonadaceae bacterium]QYK59227.1 MAG: adenylate/guanylate cyclase domain-containing protein [Fimbriimonadaceae bacterium]